MPALSSIVFCISSRISASRSRPPVFAEDVALEPSLARPCACADDVRADSEPRREAYSAAARPARAPKTSSSGSEFDPSRFAPLMLTHATSPAAYSPGQRRRPVDVGVDAAHHVVHDRPHRDQLLDRIEVLVLQAQLADERDLRVDDLLAQVTQVEVHHRAVRRLDRAPLLQLLHERLRQPVARPQLHASAAPAWAAACRGCSPAGSGSRPC